GRGRALRAARALRSAPARDRDGSAAGRGRRAPDALDPAQRRGDPRGALRADRNGGRDGRGTESPPRALGALLLRHLRAIPRRTRARGGAPRRHLDAVVAVGGFRRDVALGDVAADRVGLALGGRAVAAAAARHDAHALTRGDRVLRGLADVAHAPVGRGDLDAVDGARLAPVEPPRRRGLALEAERDEGGRVELVLALDPEAAAVAAGRAA